MSSRHPKYGDASYTVFSGTPTGLELEGRNNEHPITLGEISAFDMTSFLDVTESRRLDGDSEPTFSQWIAALHLATMWSFDNIREKIIEQVEQTISTADPIDRIEASLKCRVEKWLHPAYVILCKRESVLSDAEAERLGLRRSMAIWRVREALRPIQPPQPIQPSRPSTYRPPVQHGDQSGFIKSLFSPTYELEPEPFHYPDYGDTTVVLSDAKALDLIKKEEALKFS
ncbi:hypothetical protein FRC00_001762 [Tulasnella sp. 408]|nr:hypothetical protein FRC00_001762 [Tulasnella sp. 408]